MNVQQFKDAMIQLGLTPEFHKTGHPDWGHVRVFHRDGTEKHNELGVYICKGKFLKGKLYNVRWHCGYIAPVTTYSHYPTAYRVLVATGKVIDHEMFVSVIEAATEMAEAARTKKMQARALLEQEDLQKLRRIKKRRSIKKGQPEKFMKEATDILIEVLNG